MKEFSKKLYERIEAIPAFKLLNIKVVEISEGSVSLELPFREELCNSMGNIQGGFIVALADAAGGLSLFSLLPPKTLTPTIEIKVNFLEPARTNIISKAKVIRCGSTIGTSFIEVLDTTGKVVAISIATYRILKPEVKP